MAMAVRAVQLAVIGLALLYLLARATTAESFLILRRSLTTTIPPLGSAAFPLGSDAPPTAAARPASSHHLRAPSPSGYLPDATAPHGLSVSAVARQDQDVIASPRAAPPCPPRRADKRAATVISIDALPLLAVPFLPLPVAALVALSSMVAPAHAWAADHPKLTHPTCAVYYYDNSTGTVDRRRPDPRLSAECEHPLCHASAYKRAALHAQQHGREDDPLFIYCAVRVPQRPPSILPWFNVWLTLMPVADPAAAAGAAASGDRVCYVELTHLGYKEGYYIRCPNGHLKGRHSACTAFPEEEIAAAVWKHRRLNYRDTVWPRHRTPAPTEKHDEL
ncbi:unnamed protein product [Urochloa decumbens]|uniref:Uncharacterized protein n=1 Tax=Urochloa decumbens TaxID=240449 RepID=A0ABC9BLS6_9POAL